MTQAIRAIQCDDVPAVLATWDPEDDLDEDVAVHVGVCDRCRAVFDARFVPAVAAPIAMQAVASLEPPPVVLVSAAVAHASGRSSPVPSLASGWSRRRWSAVAVVLLIAALSVALGSRREPAAAVVVDPYPPQCVEELVAALLPECPPG